MNDQALDLGKKARSSVESARSDLVGSLNASGDTDQAAKSSIARAQALSAGDGYSPLGQLFTTFTGALGQQAGWERAAALSNNEVKGRYNTGLFAPSPDAVKRY